MRTSPVLFAPTYPAPADLSYVDYPLFGNALSGFYLNPYADVQQGYKDYSRSRIDAQFQITQKLPFVTEGLTARVMVNTSRSAFFDVRRKYSPFYFSIAGFDRQTNNYFLQALNPETGTQTLDYDEGQKDVSSVLYGEAALNYSREFNKHTISGMLVGIMRNQLVGNAGDLQSSLPFRNLGVSGRTTYVYDNRYSAEFNFGYNGTERFYKTERFGFFPSAGVAWTVSNEKFMEPLSNIITQLKLRATYGLVGNDAIGSATDRFFYLSNVNMNDGSYSARFGSEGGYARNGISVSRYANFDITWERAKKTNIGLQFNLFNKLNFEADYFNEKRDNILMTRGAIPSTQGLYASARANVGEASARGVDGNLTYDHSFGNTLWLKAMSNFTYATSQFDVYEEPILEDYQSRVGYPITQQWGYIAERLFVDDAEVENSPRQNFGPYKGGDIKYKDVNGDGQITTLDRVPLGYPTDPEIVYGFGLSGGFKAFDMSFFFQGASRSTFWIDAEATAPFINYTYKSESDNRELIASQLKNNQLLKAYADSYWSEENRNIYALWPRLDSKANNNNTQKSTWFMRNGAFLRLKQVEFGYTIPKKLLARLYVAKARVYINGTNLLTLSKFKLWDVEMGGNGLGYPLQRVFNGGLNVSF